MKGLVNSAAYADGLRVGEVAIPDISEVLKQPGRFVWVDLHEPDEEMLAEIQQEFSLHDLAVEDAARAHQRPKLERYGNSIFVVLRTARIDPSTGGIDYGETHIFVGPNYVVSVRHGGSLPYVDVRATCTTTRSGSTR
jgi:magnesium transporter